MIESARTIGVVCCDTTGGGAERATFIWAKRRSGFGDRIVWFCRKQSADAIKHRCSVYNLDWELVSLSDFDLEVRVQEFRDGLLQNKVGLVLLPDHWHKSVFSDITVAKSVGCRIIVAEHNAFHWPMDTCNFELMRRRNEIYRAVDAITVLSPINVAWWEANGFKGKVVYMPNYLSFEVLPESASICTKDNELVFMGRICELKGAHLVLDAVSRAIHEKGLVHAHLTFVGRFESAEFETRIRQQVRRLRMERYVTFTGQVDDVQPYLMRGKLLIMGSRIEGAPMVLMEAKSYSVPSVLFEMPYVDGTAEGQGVIAVPYGDVEALAVAIAEVCTNASLYERLALEARRSLVAYQAKEIDARWRRLFEQISGGDGRLDPGCAAVAPEWALATLLQGISNCTIPMSAFQRKASADAVALQVIRNARPFRMLRRLARAMYGMVRKELPLWATV